MYTIFVVSKKTPTILPTFAILVLRNKLKNYGNTYHAIVYGLTSS